MFYLLTIPESLHGTRLDKALSALVPELSRSRVQGLMEEGHVARGDVVVVDASHKVRTGEEYHIHIPPAEPSHISAENITLNIVYEDAHLLIINKPPGMTVHPAPGNRSGTLVNALLSHCGASLSGIGGVARPGIVHRIDKDTSGLLVVAKHDAAHAHLSAQLADRSLKRTYLAVVWGCPRPRSGTITGNIGRSPVNRQKMAVVKTGGKPATTHYRVVEDFGGQAALVQCDLETGRTHQIRVHLTHAGHALLGDPVYGSNQAARLRKLVGKGVEFTRQALHAAKLQLVHPETDKMMEFEAPMPDDMRDLLAALAPLK